MIIKINNTDYTDYCSIEKLTFINYNLDGSQVFSSGVLRISRKIGISNNLSKSDFVEVIQEGNRRTFKPSFSKESESFFEYKLTSIWDLKDVYLTTYDGTQSLIKEGLRGLFLGDALIDNSIAGFLKLIIKEVAGVDATVVQNVIAKDSSGNDISNIYSLIFMTDLILSWYIQNDKPTSLKDLLVKMQKDYGGFQVYYSHELEQITIKSLPIYRNISEQKVTNRIYRDPDFFNLKTVTQELNPFYSIESQGLNSVETLDLLKDPLSIESIEYAYRNDLEYDNIDYPEGLSFSIQFNPYKFKKVGIDYYLQPGYYHSYHRYFTYQDLEQEATPVLNYFESNGYEKKSMLTNQSIVNFKLPRKLTYNEKQNIYEITINTPRT